MNYPNATIDLAPEHEVGQLGIKQLKRFWGTLLLQRSGQLNGHDLAHEWQLNKTLLAALGLGLEPVMIYAMQNQPTFEEFENWVIATAGLPSPLSVARFNDIVDGEHRDGNQFEPFLTNEQQACWDEQGYVIIPNVVSREQCDETIEVICNHIGIKRDDPKTWYTQHPARQGIMVQLFKHPVLQRNREAHSIRRAYEHVWQRKDIWQNTDRVGFNPPETSSWHFPGPRLHWDCKPEPPIPFGTQGILYLADTEANQGAFTLVPGFQHKVDNWLSALPAGTAIHQMDLYALGTKPIVAKAGDFIIWQQALPHGSSPNRSAKPRFVHYINYEPAG